jgi:hypothetical protein
MPGGKAFGVTQLVLEKVSAEKPADGISKFSSLKKRDLRLRAEIELMQGMGCKKLLGGSRRVFI